MPYLREGAGDAEADLSDSFPHCLCAKHEIYKLVLSCGQKIIGALFYQSNLPSATKETCAEDVNNSFALIHLFGQELKKPPTMNHGPRLANLNEVVAIEEIVRQAYSPYIERIGRPPGPMLEDYSALVKERRVSVIEQGRILQAILVLIPEKNSLLLDNVAVSPSAQGLGLGRRMMEYAEKIALEVGYPSIRLYTNEAMAENIRYYARLGYMETHRVEEKGLKRVYMSKILN